MSRAQAFDDSPADGEVFQVIVACGEHLNLTDTREKGGIVHASGLFSTLMQNGNAEPLST